MGDLRIELSSGSRDGIRILKLIGPYMDSAALGSILSRFKVAGVDGLLAACARVSEAIA